MIDFTAHTLKCVCHCRRAMFRVLGMYNFGVCTEKLHQFEKKNIYLGLGIEFEFGLQRVRD